MFWGIDIGSGSVTYDDISFLSEEFDPRKQIDYLKEDMLQIQFEDNLLLDVGWRPSFDEEGAFYVSLVNENNWETPVFHSCVHDVAKVKKAILAIVNSIKQGNGIDDSDL